MGESLLHTPEGVRDIYNQECARKLVLQENLQGLLKQYGYHAIQTPTFEFFDIFGREIGTTPSRDLYKFFDREGNTLVLRPDITPSIARSVTKYFAKEELPVRLWYQGSAFINNSSYQGRLKETTQLGAELIGDDSVEADAEILALVAQSLQRAGLKEFQISVGHVDFLKGLIGEAGLSSGAVEELEELISNKNFFGVEELVEPVDMDPRLKKLFSLLGRMYNDSGELSGCLELAKGYPLLEGAIRRLMELYDTCRLYGVEDYISMELGIISSYRYYTGIIFAGYTFGSGEAIVKGGRYDDLLPYFGKDAPSIGFAVSVDQLMAALARQKIEICVERRLKLLVYAPQLKAEAIAQGNALRSQGQELLLLCKEPGRTEEDYRAYAKRFDCVEVLFLPEKES